MNSSAVNLVCLKHAKPQPCVDCCELAFKRLNEIALGSFDKGAQSKAADALRALEIPLRAMRRARLEAARVDDAGG